MTTRSSTRPSGPRSERVRLKQLAPHEWLSRCARLPLRVASTLRCSAKYAGGGVRMGVRCTCAHVCA